MRNHAPLFLLILTCTLSGPLAGQGPPPRRLPIKEVTVFKDGHALVLSEGVAAVDPEGSVVLDELPTPVLGTFWPYSAPGSAKLTSVVAGRRRVGITRTAIDLRALGEANRGAEAWITEKGEKDSIRYAATILSVPTRSIAEQDVTDPAPGTDHLPVRAGFFLARVADGTRTVQFDRLLDVTFKTTPKGDSASDEMRNSLTLRLGFDGTKAETARVGVMYLQKGLRWIPSYKVDIDGKGEATVRLQATLVNDLADLAGVNVNLVIGVPTFDFKDSIDPMALQETLVRVAQQMDMGAQSAYAFSNSIQSQVVADPGERLARSGPDPENRVSGASRAEDLFVFNVTNVTLRRGERMVMPVADFRLKYEDVYTLDLPQAPPPDVQRQFNTSQQAELAKQMATPKVQHKLRLINSSAYPLTTAPALILSENRPLAQGLMTYTAIGAKVDLAVTTAVDVSTKKSEREVSRTPNAATWNGSTFGKIELAGAIDLTNRSQKAVTLEISRTVGGNVDSVTNGGRIEKLSWLSDADAAWAEARPAWWHWYGWPTWWTYFNGVGKMQWTVTVEPGASLSLGYTWHYFWN